MWMVFAQNKIKKIAIFITPVGTLFAKTCRGSMSTWVTRVRLTSLRRAM
jgi:hypothetical protein